MSLFKDASFTSHAGVKLDFKIECDALTDEDIETLARRVAARYTFSIVVGIPRGGLRFAKALQKFSTSTGGILIVDDVFTTGMSMETVRSQLGAEGAAQGVVIFARSAHPLPDWIQAIFHLSDWAGP